MAEFGICPCPECRRTPSIKKMISEDMLSLDPKRYTLSCCQKTAYGMSETQVIVNWNKIAYRAEVIQPAAI